jgi:hypothetical protein
MIDQQVTPFAQARDQILQSAASTEFEGWLREQAGQIQVDPSFGRYDTQQLQVIRITSTDPSATASPVSTPVNGAAPSP